MAHEENNAPDGPSLDESTKKEHVGFFKRINKHRDKAKQGFQTLKEHLAEESDETKTMVDIYQRWMEGKATKEEMKQANEQFKDLIRIAGMGTFFGLVPGSMLLLPLAVIGANKVGIRLLPTAFMPDQEALEAQAGDESPSDQDDG